MQTQLSITALSLADQLKATTGAEDPLLDVRQVAAVRHESVPTIWRRVAEGSLPRPLKLGRLSRWPLSEVLGSIERAKAARSLVAGGPARASSVQLWGVKHANP
ncbi:helix-turn-helix transcriptional regulator [Devosia sp. CN2-171]|uniref:helix-turn-helix transcriptional regulator n=1 Tax=Devosia sp. CN2-171 TaxID=3400909 RepID=UPI003BF8D471